jgi:hypothetical protein
MVGGLANVEPRFRDSPALSVWTGKGTGHDSIPIFLLMIASVRSIPLFRYQIAGAVSGRAKSQGVPNKGI